jgi:hypothetical protein
VHPFIRLPRTSRAHARIDVIICSHSAAVPTAQPAVIPIKKEVLSDRPGQR